MDPVDRKQPTNKILNISFDFNKKGDEFDDFFLAAGYDEFMGTISPFGKGTLQKMRDLSTGVKYIRIHNIFTSKVGDGRGPIDAGGDPISRDGDGSLKYKWTNIDKVYDTLLDLGYLPYVELGFMPEILSSAPKGKEKWKWPPFNYVDWQNLVRATALHFKERYRDKIRDFIWEVWNEPNFYYFKGGTKAYLKLYDHSVAGLYGAFPEGNFTIGGPALCLRAFRFFKKFLKHCLYEPNYVTGQIGTKLDFISYHLKGGFWLFTPSAEKIIKNLHKYQKVIAEFKKGGKMAKKHQNSKYLPDDVEVHITEMDPVVGCDKGVDDRQQLNFRNTEYYPAFLAFIAIRIHQMRREHGYNIRWVFSDNLHFSDDSGKIFKGCRNPTTAPFKNEHYMDAINESTIIAKPMMKGFQFISKMQGTRILPSQSSDIPQNLAFLCTVNNAVIRVLIVNFKGKFQYRKAEEVRISLQNLPVEYNSCKLIKYILDSRHNNIYNLWVEAGRPSVPDDELVNKMHELEILIPSDTNIFPKEQISRGILTTISPHSIVMLEILPSGNVE